jgi:hypothetical protein
VCKMQARTRARRLVMATVAALLCDPACATSCTCYCCTTNGCSPNSHLQGTATDYSGSSPFTNCPRACANTFDVRCLIDLIGTMQS